MSERQGTGGEQTTMGGGGPRNTARRSAPQHPGSRRVRERVTPADTGTIESGEPGEQTGGDDGGQEDGGS